MKNLFILMGLTLLLSTQSWAAVDFDLNECLSFDDSNAAKQECYAEDLRSSEAELSQAFNQVIMEHQRQSDNQAALKLSREQAQWEVKKNADCAMESKKMDGGSGQGALLLQCINEKTKNRTRELINFLAR